MGKYAAPIIQVLVIVVGAVFAWGQIDNRLRSLEQWRDRTRVDLAVIRETQNANSSGIARIDERTSSQGRQIDLLVERAISTLEGNGDE